MDPTVQRCNGSLFFSPLTLSLSLPTGFAYNSPFCASLSGLLGIPDLTPPADTAFAKATPRARRRCVRNPAARAPLGAASGGRNGRG